MIKTLLPDKISLAPIFTKLIPNALIVYKHKSILILTQKTFYTYLPGMGGTNF